MAWHGTLRLSNPARRLPWPGPDREARFTAS
jgi:hypothetical protein